MNNQIKEEGLTDAYLLGKYDGIKQGKADAIDECINIVKDYSSALVGTYYYNLFIDKMEQLKEQK